MGGFSLKQSFELWKLKLKLFNPKTYDAMRYVWYWCRVQALKIAIFFGHQPRSLKSSQLGCSETGDWIDGD